MNKYRVLFKFKQRGSLYFDIETDEDMRKKLSTDWERNRKEGAMMVGDYLIATDDVQWIKIEGEENIGKPSGQEIPPIREEK